MKAVYFVLVIFFGVIGAGSALAFVENLMVGASPSPGSALMALIFILLAIRMLGKMREA